jgi:hypothetical protein
VTGAPTCPSGCCGAFQHWCAGCGQPENPDGAYRICAECGHVFPTEADLVAQDLDAQRAGLAFARSSGMDGHGVLHDPEPASSGDDVWICPVCNHDF